MAEITTPGAVPIPAKEQVLTGMGASATVAARMEALPLSRWHLKARVIVGSATFFDAVDTVAIGLVLPVIGQAWHMTPEQIGWLISGGFLGQFIGAIGFGHLAERIGRISTIMITTAIFALGGLASAFATGFASMIVLRMLQGLGLGAEVPVAAAYINEIAPANKRGSFVLLYEFIFAVGIVVAGFVGRWAIPNWGWQSLFLIGSIPPLIVLFFMRMLPESPRWLARRERTAEAEAAVSRIEREITASGKTIGAPKPVVASGRAGSGTWTELFSAQYRNRTLLIWTIWITVGFISWPLTIWLPTIYRNVFKVSLEQALNYGLINNVIILVATLSCALLIDRTGRKAWFTGAFALAACSLGLLGFLGPSTASIVFVLTGLTLFGITSLNLAIYLYTPELYPTRLRAQGVGIALAWSRVAGMIAPPVIGWGMSNDGLAAVFGGLGVIALLAALVTGFFAIETKQRVLEEVSP
jgi:MFS transporter, putative metabolite:H+ symporter